MRSDAMRWEAMRWENQYLVHSRTAKSGRSSHLTFQFDLDPVSYENSFVMLHYMFDNFIE